MSSPPRTPSTSSPAPAPAAQGAAAAAAAAASGSGPATPDIPEQPDDRDRSPSPDLPLTMTASLVLTHLPRDAAAALAGVGTTFAQEKVIVRFKPVGGSAPPMPARRERSTISATSRFEAVVAYLRRTLKVAETDSLFLYVNSTFAPALDEVVGNLWRVSLVLIFSLLVLFFGLPPTAPVGHGEYGYGWMLTLACCAVLQGLERPAQRWILDDAGIWMNTVMEHETRRHDTYA